MVIIISNQIITDITDILLFNMKTKKQSGKHKSKSSQYKSKNKSNSKTSIPQHPYKISTETGIYDINGIFPNPLTGEPYRNLYENTDKININGEPLPANYVNLAKSWSSKIVYNNKGRIIDTIADSQVILLTAGTGVGKTILVPRIALHAFNYEGKVVCTIPKRFPTYSTAEFVAKCMDSNLGEHVGYYYQGTNQINKNGIDSKLIFTTTGSLISRMTGNDPLLEDYKCIIIDEAHERSVQTDQLLLLLKRAAKQRRDLKIIIMSATIDLNRFRNYFPSSQYRFGEVDAGSELSYPIKEYWLDKMPENWYSKAVEFTMKILKATATGDIMIFGKSGGDANQVCSLLERSMAEYRKEIKLKNKKLTQKASRSNKVSSKKSGKSDIPPEYHINPFCVKLEGSSQKEEQNLAKDEHLYKTLKDNNGYPYTRKIVVSTNVAESSITVEGIVYIIDSGYEYTEGYDPASRVRSLLENTIAQSAVKQRKGRAGRTRPGYCIHLYSEADLKRFEEYPTPSIEKTDITNDILDLMKLPGADTVKGVRELLDEFISPPHEKFIINSLKTLNALGAVSDITETGTITPMGYAISRFRVIKANYARAIIASHFYGVSRSVCDIVALLHEADGRMRSFIHEFRPDKKKSADWNRKEESRYKQVIKSFAHPLGDYLTLFKIYRMYLKIAKQLPENPNTVEDIGNDEDAVLLEIEPTGESGISPKQEKEIQSVRRWCRDHFLNAQRLARVRSISDQLYQTLQKIIRPITKPIIKPNTPTKADRQHKADPKEIKEFKKFMAVDATMDAIDVEMPVQAQKHQLETTKSIRQIESQNADSGVQEGGFLKQIREIEKIEKLEPAVKRFPTEEENILMALCIGNFVNIAIRNKGGNQGGNDIYVSCFAQNKKFAKIDRDSFLDRPNKIIMYDEMFMSNINTKFMKLNMVSNIPDHIFQRIIELKGEHIRYCS
jgi:pre-mRNA-splicing factor ATP-dependent RNA helicase DHX15/PRP43